MDDDDARNNAPNTRGRPFEPGNSGRPKGARHRSTRAIEALLDGEAEEITRKAIELAKGGDGPALRLCLERIAPPRKDSPISIHLPTVESAADAKAASAAVVTAMAEGEVTPDEAARVMGVLLSHKQIIETADLEARIAALEGKAK